MKVSVYFSVICLTASTALAYHDFGIDEAYDLDFIRPSRLEAIGRKFGFGKHRGRLSRPKDDGSTGGK